MRIFFWILPWSCVACPISSGSTWLALEMTRLHLHFYISTFQYFEMHTTLFGNLTTVNTLNCLLVRVELSDAALVSTWSSPHTLAETKHRYNNNINIISNFIGDCHRQVSSDEIYINKSFNGTFHLYSKKNIAAKLHTIPELWMQCAWGKLQVIGHCFLWIIIVLLSQINLWVVTFPITF